MNATIYKSLSNKKEMATVSAGQSVAAAFPGIDFKNAVVVVNGKERTADYVLREFDVVTIRELPAGMTAAIVAFAAVAIGIGVYSGIQMYKAKRAAEDAQKELDKVKEQSNKDDIDNRPFLRGASNTVAKDKSQPYICGRHLFTPYLLCSPFYKISGEDGAEEHTYIVLECGFNRQVIDSVNIDDVTIKKFGGGEPQEGAYPLDGGNVFADEGIVEIAQDGKPFDELAELNYKTVSTACNDEIPKDAKVAKGDAEYLTYSLDANAMDVEIAISFPYGLYAYDDSGNKTYTKVTITPQYSLDGGNTWTGINFSGANSGNNGFYYNVSSKELRFSTRKKFSLEHYQTLRDNGQKSILLRVRSNGNDDSKIKNDCYVLFYQSRCFDPNKSSAPAGIVRDDSAGLVPCEILEDRERAFCTVMGLRLKSSKNNEDKLKKINVITQGVARTWNGSKWSDTRSVTRNSAAWALEILTSGSHPMSRFADAEIDLESFGEFYQWCEANKFYFDYVITQGRKKGDTVNLILGNCGALLYLDLYGRLAVATDRPQENALAAYNPQNIISISNKKTFGRRTDGLRVKYTTSADDLYQEDTYLLMREVDGKPLELNADSAIKDVTVTGITTFEHVVKYARRMMAVEALRPKTTTIEVGNEGIYFTPYSKILLQDDSLKIGTGDGTVKATQWVSGRLAKIFLDSQVTFEAGKNYGIIVNCFGDNKAVPLPLKVSGEGRTDALTVETPVSDDAEAIPETGCVVSFGELDGHGNFSKITTQYLISKISRADKGFRLELVNYDEAIYETGTIPDYRNNITQKPPAKEAPIPPDYVTRGEMMEAIVNGIDTSAEPPDTPIVAECKAYRDYISAKFSPLPDEKKNELEIAEWQVNKGAYWEGFSSALSFYARYGFARETDGYPEAEGLKWQVRCRVTNTRGMKSEWSEPKTVDTSEYGTWRVSSAQGASAKVYGSEAIGLMFGVKRPNARTYYGSTKFNVVVKYDGKPIRTEADVPGSLYYYFDRETDGYPERHENADGGLRDLSLYSFTIRPVESVTGEIGEELETGADDSGYRTWRIPRIQTAADAGEHFVALRWKLDGEIPYGTVRYDVHLGDELIAENIGGASYDYRFTENLSAEEVGALEFSVKAKGEAHERTERFSVNVSGYTGYRTAKPEIRAAARREGIDIAWNRTNDFYGKCEYVLLKDGAEIFRSASETEFFLRFGEGDFPEKSDIRGITLQVRIDGDADSATSDPADTDVSGYLTHIPAVPKVYPSASGRSASLSWDAQDKVYGFTGCEIQVAKGYKVVDGNFVPVTDEGELEWYAPALGLNPYESLENYKRGEAGGFLEVKGTAVSFTLPLFGQDADGASNTPYAFRLRGKSAAGKRSGWTGALFVTCRAVSSYDVVKAWELDDKGERVKVAGALGARQIFAEELSAISASLGYITDGAMRGNEYNYWAVGDVKMDDGSMLWRGSFRVGGKDQYILVEPRLADGAPTGEYDITFVVGNYSISATGTQIRNGSFEVFDEDGNLMFGANADGSKTSVETGLYFSTVPIIGTTRYPGDAKMPIVWEYDGNAYMAISNYGYTIIKKAEISQGEFKFTKQNSTRMVPLRSVLACAKPGRVVFLVSSSEAIIFFEYETASNNFKENVIAQKGDALFVAIGNAYDAVLTDYGLVYYSELEDDSGSDYKEYECVYVGRDGRTAALFALGWRGSKYGFVWPMFRDDEDALYAIVPQALGVPVVRLDKATMTLGFASMPGIIMQTPESADVTVDTAIAHEFPSYRTHPRITDGRIEFLAMCQLLLAADGSNKADFGIRLVSASLDGIAWGLSAESPAAVRPTVYDWKPALQSADSRALLTAGFGGGRDFVCPVYIGNWQDPTTGTTFPPHLEEHIFRVDDSVPDPGYDMVDYREGALKNDMVCEIDSSSEDGHFAERVPTLAQCAVAQNGGQRIFAVSAFLPDNVRVAAFYAEEKGSATEKKPMVSGVGFFKVLRDLDTGHYRYCLDPATGINAMLEFDKDGKLLATKGDKGSPGDKGEKGEKGDKGDRGDVPLEETASVARNAAWPAGLMCVTKDTSHNPAELLGGTWKSTKVLIGFTNYYFWERQS